MEFRAFLDRVIDDGIAAARADYREGPKLEGSVEGFEDCRGKGPTELRDLLAEARQETVKARRAIGDESDQALVDAYWRIRCRELEIEWVCNVASAALMNQGLRVIVPPTARGVMKAAEIVGVRG
jgi:hypothetical protein